GVAPTAPPEPGLKGIRLVYRLRPETDSLAKTFGGRLVYHWRVLKGRAGSGSYRPSRTRP
ncbi:hypothetical protein, partial [Gluconobacter sp.]|uniref:hypothetical protein n=1 Tax=Gluconobacter sp. TaxID=1876758 RepID=UPI0039E98080